MLCTIYKRHAMAPSNITDGLFAIFSLQSGLQAQKMVNLGEMVGKGKAEEELEGEAIAGPSEEVVECSSGNILPFFP